MGLCRRESANADTASNIRLGTICGSERFGPVEWCHRPCDFESVELERGWTGGFNGHFLVADFDASRVMFCCCKNVSENWME